jgi:CAAX prenyl protease-like protein
VLTVPICEELAFRGFLLRRLSARRFAALDYRAVRWWALVLSSVLFGALHGSWFAGTIAGLLYAGLLRWRGRLAEATVAHMVTNFCLMFGTVALGRLPHWQ